MQFVVLYVHYSELLQKSYSSLIDILVVLWQVPDFDIVTYTIVMPTDLVGGIRRNLEQSQCSSSSSSGYSPCIDLKEIYRQASPNIL